MKNYQAVLFHPEGDYVTDFSGNNEIQNVWESVAEMGSRWIFYPLAFVATDKTIVDAPEGMELLKGKRIKTVQRLLKAEWNKYAESICDNLNHGFPLDMVYDFKFSSL